MNIEIDPSSREFFERKYQLGADPWNFAGDGYELARYGTLLEALSGRRFARAFEPGCSIGVFTARLAPFCDDLLAMDLSEAAVTQARRRCMAQTHVRIEQGSVSDADPGPIDLLILSEIGYYFGAAELRQWTGRLLTSLQLGGVLLASHWLGSSSDHKLSGDEVNDIVEDLAQEHQLVQRLTQRTEGFRLGLWQLS